MAALLSTLAFVAMFVMWTYYPHHLPLPLTVTVQKAAVAPPAPAAPAAPTTPVRPRNPVTDITPPANSGALAHDPEMATGFRKDHAQAKC